MYLKEWRGRERKKSTVCGFTPQMVATARGIHELEGPSRAFPRELDQKWSSGTQTSIHMRCHGLGAGLPIRPQYWFQFGEFCQPHFESYKHFSSHDSGVSHILLKHVNASRVYFLVLSLSYNSGVTYLLILLYVCVTCMLVHAGIILNMEQS